MKLLRFRSAGRDRDNDLARLTRVAEACGQAAQSVERELAGLQRRMDAARASGAFALDDAGTAAGDAAAAAEKVIVGGEARVTALRAQAAFFADLAARVEGAVAALDR